MPEQIPLMVDAATQELRQFASDETIPQGQLQAALQVALTGLVTSNTSGVLASDTILQAIGKLQAQASGKVDKVAGKVLSSNDFTNTERVKLTNIAEQATKNATDAALRDRSTHTGTQPITTITGVVGAMAGGAIIERGSNANGEYVRFADGTQHCRSTLNFAGFGAGLRTVSWTYPASFYNPPAIFGAPLAFSETGIYRGQSGNVAPSNTVASSLAYEMQNTAAGNITVNVFAIGHWK